MDSISIGLHITDRIIDIKIPTKVTILRLKELLRDSMALLQIELPIEFELVVLNKPIVLVDYEVLAHYPLGNGDQLKIVF
ncbi:type VII secretion protein, YukD family [Streptococcus oriscaviae]|uniref:Type VII secretion protein, YukD family n=1 Tax=Streptococcus oriscaviae TaxID=2781599 RepID=A0ABX7YPR1_9STRE|nr:type VII secretion protein, YukD family [Streptococcus oriscaviae]QUE55209.1 type VII secretion protein, YukD family [Streptococcus oriscaviae]